MIKAGLKHFIMDATINILAILTSAGICANKKPNGSIRILFIVLFFSSIVDVSVVVPGVAKEDDNAEEEEDVLPLFLPFLPFLPLLPFPLLSITIVVMAPTSSNVVNAECILFVSGGSNAISKYSAGVFLFFLFSIKFN